MEIKYLEIGSISNFELLLRLERQSGKKINKTPPVIFIGQDVLEGAAAIRGRLNDVIWEYQQKGGVDFPDATFTGMQKANIGVNREFQQISLATLISGALMDGINPCAFTTLVFLISYLAFIGRKGKQLLISGFLFSLGVFMAYLLAGIGVMEALNQLQLLPFVGKILRWTVCGIAFLFGLLNLYDYFVLKNRKNEQLKLELGDSLKKKIHTIIRTELFFFVLALLLIIMK